MSDPPLLLHSLREFSELIFPALEARDARSILEIGSEAGSFTAALCGWAGKRDGSVTAIEPLPQEAHRELQREHGLELIVGRSPEALEGLAAFDAYFIDGDHNHFCVTRELRHALAGGAQPLVILHDVGWPCARRDQYYDPTLIPAEHRRPFTFDAGVEPGNPGLARSGGFRGEDAFAFATEEGGPANGVLTAVEDVLADHPEFELLRVPLLFGLGFVFPRAAPWADAVRAIVAPFHESELLARVERNRIDLFLRHIDPFRPHPGGEPSDLALLGAQQREIEALSAELNTLRLQAAEAAAAPPRGG